ncbi:MAG: SH3 domain-containing protein [Geminicoccales bacterium]
MKSAPWNMLLTLLLGLSAGTAGDAKAAAGDQHSISRSNVNVRIGPSLNNPILMTINPGEAMVEVARQADWYLLEFPNRNREGWVYGPLLDSEGGSSNQGAASAPLATTVTPPRSSRSTEEKEQVAAAPAQPVARDQAVLDQEAVARLETRVAGDPERGEKVFYKCGSCHTTAPGINAQGPSLAGVFGSRPARASGFGYSVAMRDYAASGVIWNEATLDEFIRRPSRVVRGTSMPFSGIRDPQDRRDLIAFLSELDRF